VVGRLGTLSAIREWLAQSASSSATPPIHSTANGVPSAWILMGDLARVFRKDRSHFPGKPYLRPDPERVKELERFRGRVGVSWAGNHGRYSPEELTTLLRRKDSGKSALPTGPSGCGTKIDATGSPPIGTAVNLQYDQTSPLLEEPGIDLKNDVEGLFALCSVLGRVVTVSTSIAHIAGSVGCPVDVIHAPPGSGGKNDMDILNWKWPEGKNPWYGSATAYRNLKQYEMRR
jgi:hypothetical protein